LKETESGKGKARPRKLTLQKLQRGFKVRRMDGAGALGRRQKTPGGRMKKTGKRTGTLVRIISKTKTRIKRVRKKERALLPREQFEGPGAGGEVWSSGGEKRTGWVRSVWGECVGNLTGLKKKKGAKPGAGWPGKPGLLAPEDFKKGGMKED